MYCDRARFCGPKQRDRTDEMMGIGDWLAPRKHTPQEYRTSGTTSSISESVVRWFTTQARFKTRSQISYKCSGDGSVMLIGNLYQFSPRQLELPSMIYM